MITDATLARINQGCSCIIIKAGVRLFATCFAQVWDEIGGVRGDPLNVCVLAHAMADVPNDVHQELVWDQRALAAAAVLTDPRVG